MNDRHRPAVQPWGPPPANPAPTPAGPQQPRRRSWFARHKVITGVGAFFLVGMIGSAIDDEQTTTPTAAGASPSASATAPAVDRAYVAALTDADAEIVHGKPEKATSRGRNVCAAIDSYQEYSEQVNAVAVRFSSPKHPDGFSDRINGRILVATVDHLCPNITIAEKDPEPEPTTSPTPVPPVDEPNVDEPNVDVDRPRSCSRKWWC